MALTVASARASEAPTTVLGGAKKSAKEPLAPRKDTKQAQLIAMLKPNA